MEEENKQSDLSRFGFISSCPLPRQTKIDSYLPKENTVLDILMECLREIDAEQKANEEEESKR
jgi:hypothetical protein